MKRLFFTLSFFLMLNGCQFLKPDYLTNITASDLNQLLLQQDIFLLDVHIPEQKHIKGTDLLIPYNEIVSHANQLPADKNTPIYLYCKSGAMANAAAATLHELGYAHLFNLEGGADAWKKAGFPVQ